LQACQCLIELQRFDEARRRLEDELTLHPDGPQARLMLAQLFLRRRDFKQAEQLFHEYLGAVPNSARAWNGIGLAQRQTGRLNESIESYCKSAALNPCDWRPHHRLAELYMMLPVANPDKAHYHKQQAQTLRPVPKGSDAS
jgi:tetratricopeptide (TPR) repeat protein